MSAACNLSDALDIADTVPLATTSISSGLDEEIRGYYRWMFEEAHRRWNATGTLGTPHLAAAAQQPQ